ncbi:hypothetical protein NDU88_001490 [Pleurodeles waltl]|uniref:Uncharacterized protein n=1 Tax=Pleurodeles waltl TaxID=8319 RepID=A0AAV7VC23_PLEWA|nr:hypothetical protein NDU88_001490 [Pleurodeles waltl]
MARFAICDSEMGFLHPISDFAGSEIAIRAICDSQEFATSGPKGLLTYYPQFRQTKKNKGWFDHACTKSRGHLKLALNISTRDPVAISLLRVKFREALEQRKK